MSRLVESRPVEELPQLVRLSPRQQMAIECARCACRLGMNGRVLGQVPHHGLLFRLWVCVPDCLPRTKDAW